MSVADKNIVVVGGSSGIGHALVKQLVSNGANVWVYSRTKSDDFDSLGVKHCGLDILDATEMPQAPEQVHGLVYCPGSINLKPFQRLTEADFINDFSLNAVGAAKSVQLLLKNLKAANSASVVFYSTVAVSKGMPFHASIAMAKGAVEGLTKSLAAEFSPSNIRFNAIAPSLTDTPLAKNLIATEEKKEAAAKRHPLKRIGTPEELAAMTRFLLSDQAQWITAQVIGVDGGIGSV